MVKEDNLSRIPLHTLIAELRQRLLSEARSHMEYVEPIDPEKIPCGDLLPYSIGVIREISDREIFVEYSALVDHLLIEPCAPREEERAFKNTKYDQKPVDNL